MAKKDLFYDVIANPGLTLYDLASVGHSAENSVLKSADEYKKNTKVVDYFTKNGVFDEDEFNKQYATAVMVYNDITDTDVNDKIMRGQSYSPNNIWVSPQYRTKDIAPIVRFASNPDRTTQNMYEFGFAGPRTQSIDEIAQSLQVLLNPKEAAKDPSKAKWGNAPATLFDNPGEWFKDLFKPKVLATWDEDGIHIDPITHEEVEHKKGDRKLNDNGTYYYEALDGREVYGKQVLSPLNTITTDGTRLNQFDFFDSDDIKQKSAVGTLMKNAVLVGSMFIPYVGWGVAGASVLGQSIGLAGMLGKLVTGNGGGNAATLNWMEAFSLEHSRLNTKTEEAQQRPWCLENMIGMVGDVAGQLRELRAIFKFAPSIIKGKWGIDLSAKAQEAFIANESKRLSNELLTLDKGATMRKLVKAMSGGSDKAKDLLKTDLNAVISDYAQSSVNKYLKNYNEIGEQISRLYMTAITVQDTYGEAIQAGATPLEAAILTMGYAGMENKLLKSDIGRWIYPELRADKVRFNAITKALTPDIKEARESIGTATHLEQRNWINKLLQKGKDIANLDYSTGKTGIGMAVTNGLAEGFEEVSEEALADFSKSCFNVYKMVTGDLTGSADTRMDDLFTNFSLKDDFTRYALNFIGGFGGGAINSSTLNFKQLKQYKSMTDKEALGELIHMDLNGELEDYVNWLDKQGTGGNRYLSTTSRDDMYQPGTDEDNQERANRLAIKNQLQMIHNTLEAEKANLSDDSMLKIVMDAFPDLTALYNPLKRFRYNAFANSYSAGRYLKLWNQTCRDLVAATAEIASLEGSKTDAELSHAEQNDSEYKKLLQLAKAKLSNAQKQRDALLNGDNTAEFMQDVLFETNLAISSNFLPSNEVQYAEWLTGKKYNTLSDKQKTDLKDDYTTWSKSTRADQIHNLATMYWNMMKQVSKGLNESADYFEQIKSELANSINLATQFAHLRLDYMNSVLNGIITTDANGEELDPLTELLNVMDSTYSKFNIKTSEAPNAKPTILPYQTKVLANGNQFLADIANLDAQVTAGTLKNYLANQLKIRLALDSIYSMYADSVEDILKVGGIHPEVKNLITNDLQTLLNAILILQNDVSDGSQEDLDLAEMNKRLAAIRTKVKNATYTPLVEMLRNFTVNAKSGQDLVQVIEAVINKENENKTDVSNLLISLTDIETWKQAKELLKLFRATLAGARNDNMDIDNLSGNTRALNAISNTKEYAEIDKETADLAAIDIDLLLDKIDLQIGIHDLNAGNKMVTQLKTSINKNFIFYDKMVKLLDDVDEDDWDKASLDKLKLVVANMAIHKANIGTTFDERKFDLTPADRQAMEAEAVAMEDAIYDFFLANKNTLEDPEKLAKLFEGMNLFEKTNDILTINSETVSDGAFIWWLASKAALRSSDFYTEYLKIISKSTDSNPIAPIPTQELGTYAAVAAITNGRVFSLFGQTMLKFMADKWKGMDVNLRRSLADKIGASFAVDNPDMILAHDLTPSFTNILFIEGIPGSGKSTGVFESIMRMLEKSNPEFYDANGKPTGKHLLDNGIIFAHSTETNAKEAVMGKEVTDADGNTSIVGGMNISLDLKDKFTFYDKKALLSWMSADYKDTSNNGTYEYVEGVDVTTQNNSVETLWKINSVHDVPAIIFIDEWSRYTQPEISLILKFCDHYGIQVIAAGDMDLLSPKALWLKDTTPETIGAPLTDSSRKRNLSTSKYMTPYVMKLGVSMRTGNGLMSVTLENMLAWRRATLEGLNPTDAIELRNYIDNTGIYGAIAYNMTGNEDYTDSDIENIKQTIDTMVLTLKPGLKIGYIYSNPNSKLFKLITSQYKDKVDYFTEVEAQGRESLYYIVEADRNDKINLGNGVEAVRDAEDYFRSVYTGISRASQGALAITRSEGIGNFKVVSKTDSELIPDSFKALGVILFADRRRETLQKLGLTGKPLIRYYRGSYGRPTPLPVPPAGKPIPPVGPTPIGSGTQTPGTAPSPTPAANPTPTGNPMPTPPPAPSTPTGSIPSAVPSTPKYQVGHYFYDTATRSKIGKVVEIKQDPTDNHYIYVLDNGGTYDEPSIPPVGLNTLEPLFKVGETLYDSNTGITYGIITDIINDSINGGQISYQLDTQTTPLVESTLEGLSTSKPKTNLSLGDIVIDRLNKLFKVVDINMLGDLLLYTVEGLVDNTREDFLDEDFERGDWQLVTPSNPASEVLDTEELDLYNLTPEDYEAFIKEGLGDAELPEPALGEGIQLAVAGETFLTGSTGVIYDLNGKIAEHLTPNSDERIDNAFGLLKIVEAFRNGNTSIPNKFERYRNVKPALDAIRSIAKYGTNDDIINELRTQLIYQDPKTGKYISMLENTGLLLKWAVISKVKDSSINSGIYTRYTKGENEPLKTISLIIENDNNIPILEIPMIVLESPFTILYKYASLNPSTPLGMYWNSIKNSGASYIDLLTNVLNFIASHPAPGLTDLSNLCKFWLMDTNCVKFLPADWNLAAKCKNLGNWHVKSRHSEQNGLALKYEYNGEYTDMSVEADRTDVVYSDVMMTSGFLQNGVVSLEIPLWTPFVLRSDNLKLKSTNSTQTLVDTYLRELKDPNAPRTVSVVLLTPPEVDFRTYITALAQVWSTNHNTAKVVNPYGNLFTPLRLFLAIYESSLGNGSGATSAQYLLDYVEGSNPGKKQLLIDFLNKIKAVDRTQKDGESIRTTQQRIVKEEKDLLLSNAYFGNNDSAIYNLNYLLRDLFYGVCTGPGINGARTLLDGTNNDVDHISLMDNVMKEQVPVPSKYGETRDRGTGILAKLTLLPSGTGTVRNGFELVQVENSSNKYTVPGAGSFRFFGKIDTAKFNMSETLLGPNGLLQQWVNDIVNVGTAGTAFGTLEDSQEYCGLKPKNGLITPGSPLIPTPQVKETNLAIWKKKHRGLLGKLLDSILFDSEDLSEDEFFDAVITEYTKTPGNIAWKGNGKIFTADVRIPENLICDKIKDLPNMYLKEILPDTENGGDFTIVMQLNGNEFNLEIKTSGLASYDYQLIYPKWETEQTHPSNNILQMLDDAKANEDNDTEDAKIELSNFENALKTNTLEQYFNTLPDTSVIELYLGFDTLDDLKAAVLGLTVEQNEELKCPERVNKLFII